MVSCEEMRLLIGAVVDQEASPEEQQLVAEHIRQCEECRELYEMLTGVSETLKNDAEVPENFTQAVMAEVVKLENPSKKKKTFSFGRITRYAAMAACAALIIWGAARVLDMRMGSSSDSAMAENYAAEAFPESPEVYSYAKTEETAEVPAEEESAEEMPVTEESVDSDAAEAETGSAMNSATDGTNSVPTAKSEQADSASDAMDGSLQLPGEYGLYVFVEEPIPDILDGVVFETEDGVTFGEISQEQAEMLAEMGYETLSGQGDGAAVVILD